MDYRWHVERLRVEYIILLVQCGWIYLTVTVFDSAITQGSLEEQKLYFD